MLRLWLQLLALVLLVLLASCASSRGCTTAASSGCCFWLLAAGCWRFEVDVAVEAVVEGVALSTSRYT